ncbi:MAG: DivIVA domain-containing protein [Nitrospirae bacterium]|nr:DivIVA domain-containing protein [Nitrospirota bacterium]
MNGKLTPIDIQQIKFGLAFRGYSRQEVDAFLDKAASALEVQLAETQVMREQAAALEVQLLELRKKESALNNTLIAAQQVVEEMKRNAQKEVDLRLKEAELQAERLIQDAWAQLRQVTQELEEARREKQLFLDRWKSSLKTIEQALTMAGEHDTAPGAPSALERTGERSGGHHRS